MATKVVTPFKVGLMVVASFAALGAFLQIVSMRGVSGDGYRVFALFDDVLGLEKRSPVQIAGIDIGHIEEVTLVRGRAKVTLYIHPDVELYEDARVEKVSISLLGDYKLAVEPGGREGAARLADGGEIKRVKSESATDAIINEVREMTESVALLVKSEPGKPSPLERIVTDVEGSAAAARSTLEVVAKNIDENTETLDRILDNVERFTRDLSDISAGKESDVAAILKDSREIAASIRRTSESIEKVVAGQDPEEVEQSVKSLRHTLDTLNASLERLNSIAKKIDEGDGTVGALVNDRQIHDDLEEAVEGIGDFVGGLARLQTWVNLRSEFQFRAGATKNYVQFTLMPKEDTYYIFEVVDDPRGVVETVIEDVETTSPEPGRAFQYRNRVTTTRDTLSFSLQFAKRFYWLGLRFGIIEGTGGIGVDLHFLDEKLQFWVDANKFGSESRNPRIKVLGLLELLPHVYVHGGVDDFLNPGTVDYFLGAGVRFNDEDLKALLFAVGVPGIGGSPGN